MWISKKDSMNSYAKNYPQYQKILISLRLNFYLLVKTNKHATDSINKKIENSHGNGTNRTFLIKKSFPYYCMTFNVCQLDFFYFFLGILL
jgi:hypothetical protein